MKKEVERYSISHYSFFTPEDGKESDLPDNISLEKIKSWYQAMALARGFDAKVLGLQKSGKMGTYASSKGQEAVSVGYASAMQSEDVLVVPYREYAAQMMRASSPEEAMVKIMLYWGGDERGNSIEGCLRDLPMCVPIGTQTGHATGIAMAMKLREEPHAVVCVLGDGATSKGDAKAAMQWAALWHLPLVFIIVNNQWAISVPRSKQTSAVTLAQMGFGAGVRYCCQVDGNDVVAMHDCARTALARARSGQGPSVVEALTYRLGDHTTADDANRYRSREELEHAQASDPLLRTRAYLVHKIALSESEEHAMSIENDEVIDAAVATYRNLVEQNQQPVTSVLDYLHAVLPEALKEQHKEVLKLHGGSNGH